MATFDQFMTSLERDFGDKGKGKPFEAFCKWFLENDPEWSATIEKIWLWDDYPEKWQRQDLGTDLVFRDNEGLIWAVQAKCYSEHRTTTKGDLNSFLADTGRKEVDKRLWIQTTNSMEARAEKTIKGQDKPVTVIKLNHFRDAQIDYPENFTEIHKAKVKDKPRPDTHQEEAIQVVHQGLQSLDRGQLIMACGTGKTFTTLWIKESLGVENTLVLLPSLSLLSQTMREWAWAKNKHFEILNVCSDKSVGARSKDSEDMLVAEASFPVTSNLEEISRFLKKTGPKVLFCTYQSSDLIAQVQADTSVPAFDLAIADEAHRCAGKADAGFATILDGTKIRAAKRLFTTATPRYFGKAIKDEANARSIDVIGMDNEDVFGPVIYKLSFGEAIQRELLTDYQVVIVGVDAPMVKEWIDNYEIVSSNPDKQYDSRTLAAKIGLIKAIKDYDLERVISFHSNISRAREFAEELPEIVEMVEPEHRPSGEFLSNYVSGEMKAGDRKEKIEKLKKLEGFDRGILTNARCLAEGVDVPSLDGVAFIDPKGSQVDIIQAVGRAIRKVRGAVVQKKGTIVIPVFIEDGDDPEGSIEASNFKPVWDVLKALRSHDDDLAEVLDTYRTNMAKNVSQPKEDISDKVIFDLPQSVGAEFAAALRTVLVETTTASWDFWFGLLEEYKEREGDCRVPSKYKTPDRSAQSLGSWCDSQRIFYKKGTLSKARIDKLEKLRQFGWVWSLEETQRAENIRRLEAFYLREGHSIVKERHCEPDGFALGARVKSLVQAYEAGTLESEWINHLQEKLEFKWDISKFLWLAQYVGLRRWARANMTSLPPKKTMITIRVSKDYSIERDINLFRARCITSYKYWEMAQTRQNTSRKEAPRQLSKNEINALERIPYWEWESKQTVEQKFVETLGKYLKEFSIDDLNSSTLFAGMALGRQLVKVRAKYKKGKLDAEICNGLNALGVTLDPFEEKWILKYKLVEEYLSVSESYYIAQDTIHKDEAIGAWVSKQRTKYKSGKLSSAKIKKLEALPNWIWDASDWAAHNISKSS